MRNKKYVFDNLIKLVDDTQSFVSDNIYINRYGIDDTLYQIKLSSIKTQLQIILINFNYTIYSNINLTIDNIDLQRDKTNTVKLLEICTYILTVASLINNI